LDWHLATQIGNELTFSTLMKGLVSLNEAGNPQPALAATWEVLEGGKKIRFLLREDIQWTDGKSFDAFDLIAGWRRVLSPATASPWAYLLYEIEGAREFHQRETQDFSGVGVSAPEKYLFEVKLTRANAHWLRVLSFWPLFPFRSDLFAQHQSEWARVGHLKTFTPFSLQAREQGRFVQLQHSTGEAGARFQAISDSKSTLDALEKGDVQFALGLSPHLKSKILRPSLAWSTVVLEYQLNHYPVSALEIREALSHAINPSQLALSVGEGVEEAISLMPQSLKKRGGAKGKKFLRNLSLAQAKLSQAGYGEHRPLRLDLAVSNEPHLLIIAQNLQAQLAKNLPVIVSLRSYDPDVFEGSISRMGAHALVLRERSAFFPDPFSIYSQYLSKSGLNHLHFNLKEYDDLVLRAFALDSLKEKSESYEEAERQLVEVHQVLVPLLHPRQQHGFGPGLEKQLKTRFPYWPWWRWQSIR
jgi:ABC-type oligopeptide transport system substrate-binding subunit